MPAGVDWPTYLKFAAAALLSMFAGAQVVHTVYKPLQDMDVYIAEEKAKLMKQKLPSQDGQTR